MNDKLAKAWADEFGTKPVDAADIANSPRVRQAMADALPWPVDYLTPRIIGRRIAQLLGDRVYKVPTPKAQAQRWSLRS